MARSTAKKLAGKTAAAARKVTSVARKSSAKAPATTTDKRVSASATKAAAAKAPARSATKATAKSAATPKKASPKKATATKATAKKATAKKATAKKATAKKATAKKATAKKATAKKATAKKATAKKATAKKSAPGKASTTTAKATARNAAAAKKTATGKTTAAKKAAGTKAAPRDLAVKADEQPWSDAELSEVRSELAADVDRLRSELDLAEHELSDLMRDAGDGAGNDQADVGSATFERDHELSLANNARDMLVQTQHALGRIDDGTYGRCEMCGQPIGKLRLQAFPRATLCMTCKQREERR